ncbi:hypothetical protein [Thermoflexus sp.]
MKRVVPASTFRVLRMKERRPYVEYCTEWLALEAWERVFGQGN